MNKRLLLLSKDNLENSILPNYLLKLNIKKDSNLLFIGLANNYSDALYKNFKKLYTNNYYQTTYLKKSNVINNLSLVKEKINKSDVIYIAGGDTIKLMDYINNYHLDVLLQEAYNKGTLLIGVSAGAISLVKKGLSDALILRNESNNYTFIKGINLENITICPHFDTRLNSNINLKDYFKNKENLYFINEDEIIYLENGNKKSL